MNIQIEDVVIGHNSPTYFIADLAANHDGDLERAKKLIVLAQRSGANAVKFQHFNAQRFVSDKGFRELGNKQSHQSNWKKTIYETYEDASIPLAWTCALKEYCDGLGITFFSSPYGLDMVEHLNPYVPAWKIGSGDLNFHLQLEKVALTKKPVLVATGASTLQEVTTAMAVLQQHTDKIVLMQCNTNYTAKLENFNFINLNVLNEYKRLYPNVILGLSDHTLGSETVLGAVALGARVIEKHFTDNNSRKGPDHFFSMNPATWKEMVNSARKLEMAMGVSKKEVCENERETVVLQRRSLRAKTDLRIGTILRSEMFERKRPCPTNALDINYNFNGAVLKAPLKKDDYLQKEDLL